MKKIHVFFLVLISIPAILFVGILVFSCLYDTISESKNSKTWYCKDNNMYITIVDQFNENDLIILNKTDTIFTSDDLGKTLYGVELHFKPNNDTVLISCDYLAIARRTPKKYTIIPTKLDNTSGYTLPIIFNNTDITVTGNPDHWEFYVYKNGEYTDDILEVVN